MKIAGLTCFSCLGIAHPRFCDYVEDCTSEQVIEYINELMRTYIHMYMQVAVKMYGDFSNCSG